MTPQPGAITRTDGELLDRLSGITAFAGHQLGDVTQAELSQKGASVKQGGVFGSVESVKAVSDLFAPMTGTAIKVNAAPADEPELLNDDPYVGGMNDPDLARGTKTSWPRS